MYFECRHIMYNGAKCHSPALGGKDFCYYHSRIHRRVAIAKPAPATAPVLTPVVEPPVKLPLLEDRSAILVAVSHILEAVASSKLDTQRAGTLLYGLQIASQNVERRQDILPYRAVESITHTREGDELGPKLRICDSNDDCSTCDFRETCPDSGIDDDEKEDQDES